MATNDGFCPAKFLESRLWRSRNETALLPHCSPLANSRCGPSCSSPKRWCYDFSKFTICAAQTSVQLRHLNNPNRLTVCPFSGNWHTDHATAASCFLQWDRLSSLRRKQTLQTQAPSVAYGGRSGLWHIFFQWPLLGMCQAAAIASISNSSPGMARRVTPSNVIGGATW